MPATELPSGLPRPDAVALCIVGLGYIGLPTATLFAGAGVRVHGADVNPRAVASIARGKPHIVEPGLDAVVAAAVASGRLTVSTAPVPADTFILAVPTPFKNRHEPDLSYVEAAGRSISRLLRPGNLVVLESTSPVGTTEMLARLLAAARPDLAVAGAASPADRTPVYVAHCPERVLPGNILNELVHNDRVVGGIDAASAEKAKALYAAVCRGGIHLTSAGTAELTKLTENAFRDVNIAFANELSTICERVEIDVWELIGLANLHPRVNILNPGPGVGGHCIAVDPWFIIHSAPAESRLIALARDINDARPHWVVGKVKQAIDGATAPVIACLGLAYKADTDDLRESPAVEVVELAAAEKLGTILVADPYIEALPPRLDGAARLVSTEEAIGRADIIVLLVDHREFKGVPEAVRHGKTVIDTRGIWR